jgi:hypothetical protein
MLNIRNLTFFLLVFFQAALFAEELIIIKAVSSSGRSFAISRGSDQGIGLGQTSLFSSEEASFKAKAVSVDKNYSLWQVSDNKAKVPFEKDEFVHFSNSLENIWTQLPKTAFLAKKELGFKEHNVWIVRLNYSYAITESISDTSSDQYDVRSGFQLEALYGRRFDIDWEIAGGFRYDRETTTLQNPSFTIPTTRMMAVAEGTYHFYRFPASNNSMYFSLGAAYGISNTSISDTTISGTSFAIPVLKVGMIYKNNSRYTWIFEGSFESINSEESFTDGTNVSTSVTNTKFGVGMRF